MRRKKGADRTVTLAHVEQSLALKEAHLPWLQASTLPKAALERFVASIEQQRALLAALRRTA